MEIEQVYFHLENSSPPALEQGRGKGCHRFPGSPWVHLSAHVLKYPFEAAQVGGAVSQKYGFSQCNHPIGCIQLLTIGIFMWKSENIMVFAESNRPLILVIFLYEGIFENWK